MLESPVLVTFAQAYRDWRGVGPRGRRLKPLVENLRDRYALHANKEDAQTTEDSFYSLAIALLDEAWERHIRPDDLTEESFLDIYASVLRNNRVELRELDPIKLARPVQIYYDPEHAGFDARQRTMPKDSIGTIMLVTPGKGAYDVEFSKPFPALALVREEDIVK